jgi:uncharacterized protein (TIRG00374 family)
VDRNSIGPRGSNSANHGRDPSGTVIKGTQRSLAKLIKHFAIRGASGLIIFLVVEYLVLPQLAGFKKTLHLLAGANYALVPLSVVAEGFSLFAYSKLTASVLPKPQPTLKNLTKVNLSSLAVSHVLPGGTASGAGLSVRLLNSLGVRGTDAGFALATQGIGSAVVLNLILWIALIISLPLFGFNAIYLTVALLGALLMALFIFLIIAFTRGEEHTRSVLDKTLEKIPGLRKYRSRISDSISRISHRVRDLARDPERLRSAILWASLNWLFDALSLWIMLAAFGSIVNPDALLVSYGIANVAAALPITPGGLGVVEGLLIPLLTGFGTPRGIAILGVLSYRLFNFWIPIPLGVGTYVSLRMSRGEEVTMELERIKDPRRKNGPNDSRG